MERENNAVQKLMYKGRRNMKEGIDEDILLKFEHLIFLIFNLNHYCF